MDKTPKEIELELVEAWVLNEFGEARDDVVRAIIKGPEFLITPLHLEAYTAYLALVRDDKKTILKRGSEGYDILVATEADVIRTIGKLNRGYTVEDNVAFSIDGIMMHTHCPADGLPYKQEVQDADE